MAEIAIVASIIQIADVGLRLSTKLYTFGQIVARADEMVSAISKDISLTSSVLKELGDVFKETQSGNHVRISENAVKTADEIINECSAIFNEIDTLIIKKLSGLGMPGAEKVSRVATILQKLKMPYLQPKIRMLQTNLDRLKATMVLMLNVVVYAKQVSSRDEAPVVVSDQKVLIEDLDRSRQDCLQAFNRMTIGMNSSATDKDRPQHGNQARNTQILPSEIEKGSSTANKHFDTKTLNDPILRHAAKNLYEVRQSDAQVIQLKHYHDLLIQICHEIKDNKYKLHPSNCAHLKIGVQTMVRKKVLVLAQSLGTHESRLVDDFHRFYSGTAHDIPVRSCISGNIPACSRTCKSTDNIREVQRAVFSREKRSRPSRYYPIPDAGMYTCTESATSFTSDTAYIISSGVQPAAQMQPSLPGPTEPETHIADDLVALWTVSPSPPRQHTAQHSLHSPFKLIGHVIKSVMSP